MHPAEPDEHEGEEPRAQGPVQPPMAREPVLQREDQRKRRQQPGQNDDVARAIDPQQLPVGKRFDPQQPQKDPFRLPGAGVVAAPRNEVTRGFPGQRKDRRRGLGVGDGAPGFRHG